MYRMHMLLPEGFTVRGADGSSKEQIWTGDTALAGARAVMVSHTCFACSSFAARGLGDLSVARVGCMLAQK